MVEATLGFLNENVTKWQSIAKIGEVKNKLAEVYAGIENTAMTQLEAQVNMGKVKLELKRVISQKADILNDLIEVYAQMTNKPQLAQAMADSATDLYRMRNDDMMRKVKLIIGAAVENQEALVAEYGMTAEQITDLQADYDRFMEVTGQPREYQIKSGVATTSLDELFAQATDLLSNQLDGLMKIFKRRDTAFYNGYEKARTLVEL